MYKILAIDDSPTMHRLFKMIFNEDDYELRLADSGYLGLELVKEFKPDIILLDFVMPKLNGFQFCKILREEMGINDIPILLITSKAEDVGDKFAERFCNVDYIAKPFQPEDLIEKIKIILSTKDVSQEDKLFDELADDLDSEVVELQALGKQDNTIDIIVSKVEKSISPFIKSYIEKYLRLETAYMISDIKGDKIDINKILELISAEDSGEIVIFNASEQYTFYYENGVLVYGWCNGKKIEGIFELFQDVFNVCLLEVDIFTELYEQLKGMNCKEEIIKKTFISYIMDLLNSALSMEDAVYYVNKIDIPNDYKAKVWIHTDNLIKHYSGFIEEQAEINKIIFDDNIIPFYHNKDTSLLTDFEKRLLSLCDGKHTVGKILSFFGSNKRFVKSILGALVMTNFIKFDK